MKMKLFVLLACLFTFSCNEEETQDGIDGKWKLVRTSGTITGAGITTDWNKIVVDEEAINFFKDAKLLESGTVVYTHDAVKDVHKVVFNFSNKSGVIIDLKGDPEKNYKIEGTKLTLNSECCDRVNYELKKE